MKTRALNSFEKFVVVLVLPLTSTILLPNASWAQIDVFASVAGLQCSSTDAAFPGAMLVRSLSGGVSGRSGASPGSGAGGRQPSISPLKIAKDFDQCSPLLFRAAVVGQVFARVTISFRNEINRVVFFEIELTNVMVQDMIIGANDALAQTSEEVSFTFERIKLTDIVIDVTGTALGTVVAECDFTTLKCT